MELRTLGRAGAVLTAVAVLAGCTGSAQTAQTPGLAPRGTVLSTVKPVRQNVSNQISLAGKVTINPVFGIVAPVDGELRYVDRRPSRTPATRPIWVASVWHRGVPRRVEIPKDSLLAGRLLEDRASVTAGMPVISAEYAGYGIVADIDSDQAYRITTGAKATVRTVRAQIKNGPGPFTCTALGTIAALPAGTIPAPSKSPEPGPGPSGQPVTDTEPETPSGGSEATGLRLVCTAPDGIKLINGAAVTVQVVTAKATGALVLPVEAVAGVQGRGKVDVVGPDQTRRTVDVVLGLTDGKVVQIKSGLKGDETIAVPGPDLPAAAPGGAEQTEGPR